eukprot:2477516-Amphidinium_carterae.1
MPPALGGTALTLFEHAEVDTLAAADRKCVPVIVGESLVPVESRCSLTQLSLVSRWQDVLAVVTIRRLDGISRVLHTRLPDIGQLDGIPLHRHFAAKLSSFQGKPPARQVMDTEVLNEDDAADSYYEDKGEASPGW